MEGATQTEAPAASAAPAAPAPPAPEAVGDDWASIKAKARTEDGPSAALDELGAEVPAADAANADAEAAPEDKPADDKAKADAKEEEPKPEAEEKKPEPKGEKPTTKAWKEFLARKEQTERRLANRAQRLEAREAEIESKAKQLETRAQEAEAKLASIKGVDSDDPYEVWKAIVAAKKWQEHEALGVVNRRILNNGELTVEDRIAKTEQQLRAEVEKKLEEERARLAEERRKLDEEQQTRAHEAQRQQATAAYKAEVLDRVKAGLEAGEFRYLRRLTPEQTTDMVFDRALAHYVRTSRRDANGNIVPNTGEEIPFDNWLRTLETEAQQEYEAWKRLDSERDRPSAERSDTGQGNGAVQSANPGTQSASGQRKPTTVTTRLAAQRSDSARPASEHEEWEAAKKAARQRAAQ